MPSNKSLIRKKTAEVIPSFREKKRAPLNSRNKSRMVGIGVLTTMKLLKVMKKSVSDETFSTSYLSSSTVSTPVGMNGRVKKRKRKVNRVIVGDNSVLLSGMLEDARSEFKDTTEEEDKVKPPTKRVKVSPPVNEDNDHVGIRGIMNKSNPPFDQVVRSDKADDLSIIVIEEDERHCDEDGPITVAKELMGNGKKSTQVAPVTPSTFLQKLKDVENVKNNNTIVIDDDGDEDDLVIVVNQDRPPLPTSLKSGYLKGMKTSHPDKEPVFIPGRSGTGEGRRKKKFIQGRGGRFGGHTTSEGRQFRKEDEIPVFNSRPPNIQFTEATASSSRSGVFRFTGSKQGQGLTMLVGQPQDKVEGSLRPIVIDGSNVAMSHGKDSVFSAKGIELVVNFFIARGHKKVVAFVPHFRSKYNMSSDRELLEQLYKSGRLVYTPSREVGCTRISSYDDAFILDYAATHGGIVITRDNYRDLAHEKPEWLEVVLNRILMPTFVGDDIMFPFDPLGRRGPNLNKFLKF